VQAISFRAALELTSLEGHSQDLPADSEAGAAVGGLQSLETTRRPTVLKTVGLEMRPQIRLPVLFFPHPPEEGFIEGVHR